MRVEVGAPVMIVPGTELLYHLPERSAGGRPLGEALDAMRGTDDWPTVCGLSGPLYALQPRGERRLCSVCREQRPGVLMLADGTWR